jgi:hypothetical protein
MSSTAFRNAVQARVAQLEASGARAQAMAGDAARSARAAAEAARARGAAADEEEEEEEEEKEEAIAALRAANLHAAAARCVFVLLQSPRAGFFALHVTVSFV